MTITNGYATLAELKQRLHDNAATYTAATLSFTASSKKIADSAYGLKRFQTGDLIRITGSTSNNGFFTVATGNTAGEVVVNEALTDEAAGQSVTITAVNDQVDDAILESVVEAVSRWIDETAGRRFYAVAETRVYTAEHSDELAVNDLLSVTTLKTDDDGDRVYDETWATTDYDLLPLNANLDGKPYTRVAVTPRGTKSFPVGVPKGVQIAGSFGYASSAPRSIKEACLLQSERLARRKEAIFGVAGSGDMGHLRAILSQDPDVMSLLQPFIKLDVWVV